MILADKNAYVSFPFASPMKIVLPLLLCIMTGTARGQYLKVDNGILFSSFSNNKNLPLLNSTITTYAVQAGADYWEHSKFYLSSQIGYISIGGRETNPYLSQPEYQKVTERKGYVHLNTTFRPYLKAGISTLFAGLGPTINLPLGSRKIESSLYEGYRYTRVRVGGKAELGITEDIKKFRLGLLGAYLFDLSPAAKTEFIGLYNKAFSLVATVGYRLE